VCSVLAGRTVACVEIYLCCFPLLAYAVHRDLPALPTRRSSDLHPLGNCDGHKNLAPPSAGGNPARSMGVDATPAIEQGCRLHSRSEEHTSELQSRVDLVCRLLLEKKKPRDKLLLPNAHE